MILERKNTEICDQSWKMHAEGTSDEMPSGLDVENHLKEEGWVAYNIDVWFDRMQGFWRWDCKIKRP